MIADNDPFKPLLDQFMNINYTILQDMLRGEETPNQPLDFHDRHIGTGLRLKSIKRAAWIPDALAQICEDTIKNFTAAGHSFIENDEYWDIVKYFDLRNPGSDHVARQHLSIMSNRCNVFASKLLFHPDDTKWFSFLLVEHSHTERSFYQSGNTSVIQADETDSGKKDFEIPPETRQLLADWVIPTISKLDKRSPVIFNYEFYSRNALADDMLEKMGPCTEFNWEHPTTIGASAVTASARPLDSRIIRSLFPALVPSSVRAKKPAKGTKTANTATKIRKVVPPLERAENREHRYRVKADHYIQRAWTNAVTEDVSFIVFNSGRSERIGIRHRETQTLYLSDMIHPIRAKGYGQIHLGLTIAALKESIDRINLKPEPDLETQTPKRSRELVESNGMKDKATRRKRQKLSPDVELTFLELDRQSFGDELAKRDIALLYFDDDVYQSPAPSTFRRMEPSCVPRPFVNRSYDFKRKRAYPPQGYISVTVNRPILGQGAVGLVYRVLVEIEMASGAKHQRDLVLKLGTGPKKEKMVEEYNIYKQLAEAGVTDGIVGVHGLFHDMETDTMIMLMDDAGQSLRARAIERGLEPYDYVETTEEECAAFVKALNGIHNAGIVHTDLRIDNLTINDNGEVFIIDFDCAEHLVRQNDYFGYEDMKEMMSAIGWGEDSDSADNE